MTRTAILVCTLMVVVAGAVAAPAGSLLPAFKATSLEGKQVTAAQLVGRPTILIVTPSRAAADDTREWVQALARNFDEEVRPCARRPGDRSPLLHQRVRRDAKAKSRIPARYHSRTWLLAEPSLEKALGIPTDSASAFVFVLDSRARVVTRVEGSPTAEKVDDLVSAIRKLTR